MISYRLVKALDLVIAAVVSPVWLFKSMLYVFSVKGNWETHQLTTELYVLNIHSNINDTRQNNVANDAEEAPER